MYGRITHSKAPDVAAAFMVYCCIAFTAYARPFVGFYAADVRISESYDCSVSNNDLYISAGVPCENLAVLSYILTSER